MKIRSDLNYKTYKYKDKKWFQFIYELMYRIKEDEVMAVGGQLTYFLILSIFPFLIFFLNILSYTSIARDDILNNLLIVLPIETQIMLKGIIKEVVSSSSETLLSIGIILTLWTGSLGITAIIRAVNKAYGVEKKRPFWRMKGIAIVFTIVLALLLIIVMSMLVFGEVIGNEIFAIFGATHIFHHIWQLFRIVIPFISMIIIFASLYKISPTPEELKISFRQTLPGAIFTTTGWIIASIIFSYYVNNFANYSKTYGSLGGIIILLVWLYMSSIMIILGGEINGTYAAIKNKHGKKVNNKKLLWYLHTLMGIITTQYKLGVIYMKNTITIEYCTSWGYVARAVALTRMLLREHDSKIKELKLIPSTGGVYEVTLNDELVFSKKELDRHAEKDEVENIIKEKIK